MMSQKLMERRKQQPSRREKGRKQEAESRGRGGAQSWGEYIDPFFFLACGDGNYLRVQTSYGIPSKIVI
jgi:hypothetical protein